MENSKSDVPEVTQTGMTDDVMEEILENIPEPSRNKLTRVMISSQLQMHSPENVVSRHINSGHITEFLEGSRENMQNHYKEKKQNKLFVFGALVLAMVFIAVIIVLLKDVPDTMENVLYLFGGLFAGVIGGYGFGKSKGNDD